MGLQRGLEWPTDQEVYNESQIAAVLEEIGIEVKGETENVFMCLCPFHSNFHSPAMVVSKYKGLYYCNNGGCGARGNLKKLIAECRADMDTFAINRMLNKYKEDVDFLEARRMRVEEFKFEPYTKHDLKELRSAFPNSPAHEYMRGRGFTDDTLKYFDVGYSKLDPLNMAVVPVHDPDGMEIGFVGRSIVDKRFQNSDRIPKSKTLFNYHNAKKTGGTVIVSESSFDTMAIHQAGYPNAVATLGSSLSNNQRELLGRTFDTIINLTDWDFAGRKLGQQIEDKFRNKTVKWAALDDGYYPRLSEEKMCKDAAEMNEELGPEAIRQVLRSAMSPLNYHAQIDKAGEELGYTMV
jgi:DNA primase